MAKDLVWRKKELAAVKALVENKSFSHSKHSALLRSGVALLYAHWEGFVKTAASSYLEYVSMQRLRYDELSSNFVALALKSKLKEATEANKATVFTEAIDFVRLQLNKRSSLQYKDIIQTGSNLSSSILKDILCTLGIDGSVYATKQVVIDEKLLARRNRIAHGEYLLLDRESYIELHSQVIEMMQLFNDQIENCAALKSYCCI
ncbi:MAE_28990/MAE_18760 family HEPN-like nuclease [Phormidesmis priestleyi]